MPHIILLYDYLFFEITIKYVYELIGKEVIPLTHNLFFEITAKYDLKFTCNKVYQITRLPV